VDWGVAKLEVSQGNEEHKLKLVIPKAIRSPSYIERLQAVIIKFGSHNPSAFVATSIVPYRLPQPVCNTY